MKSVMKHQFSQIPQAQIPRSSFNRSHGFKTTFNAGYLVPFLVDEVLPGDTFNVQATVFARLATPIVPFMDNLFIDTFFFFVPTRLVWSNWQKFNGEQLNPGDSTSFSIPQQVAPAVTGYAIGSVQDYMGLPTGIPGYSHSALPLRCYNLIWREWFRDQNLQNSPVVDTGDGPDTVSNYTLLKRNKRYDYFTSCLPWPQKGTAVDIPIGTTANILGSGTNDLNVQVDTTWGNYLTGSAIINDLAQVNANLPPGKFVGNSAGGTIDITSKGTMSSNTIASKLTADLSTAVGPTINALRQAFQIQKMLERDARGGTRYIEIIRSHFGVTSPDARLQRPELLGQYSRPISVNPVVQTSNTPASGTPQGNLAAYGVHGSGGHGFVKSFTEHGFIIGLVSVRADLNYQQGLNRMWSRLTRYDHYWPTLSHLGEQAVLNQEIYLVNPTGGGAAQNAGVFGYQERYAEYRYKPSVITGQFRSTASTPLDTWHLAQKFTGLPTLGDTFIQENPPIDRVIAVPSQPHFLFDAYFKMICARPMPTYSVPGLIDHF